MARMTAKFGYATDRSAELWDTAKGDTREEAAAFALAEWPEVEQVYVVDCQHHSKADIFDYALDADRIMDIAEESASESEGFGHYEDNLLDHSADAQYDLQRLLHEAVERWLESYPGEEVWTTIGGTITEHKRPR